MHESHSRQRDTMNMVSRYEVFGMNKRVDDRK